jgi:hypothetical protein
MPLPAPRRRTDDGATDGPAARRPSISLTAIAQQLADALSPLDRFAALDVRAVLSWSYRSLTERSTSPRFVRRRTTPI